MIVSALGLLIMRSCGNLVRRRLFGCSGDLSQYAAPAVPIARLAYGNFIGTGGLRIRTTVAKAATPDIAHKRWNDAAYCAQSFATLGAPRHGDALDKPAG